MKRREFIETAAMAAFGLTGCTSKKIAAARPNPPVAAHSAVRLEVPRISWDRVIRTTVGLRPHRDSGFVLRPEKADAKLVIHNYGFGGAGMSLAWGCGVMVSEIALMQSERKIAVLGCGSPGLTAARQLQRRGFEVTIYAMSVPPDTTSNMSLAGFTPTAALVAADKRTPAWDAQFTRSAELSYRQLQLLAGAPGYGVYWIDTYNATDDPNPPTPVPVEGADLVPDALRPGRNHELLGPGEHPFPTKYAIRTPALAIEPSIYLEMLMRDFALFGGKIVIRKFDTPRDLMSLPEPVIVNCTGLGSKSLFGDDELVPIRGQLTVCVPQPEVNYRANRRMPNSQTVATFNPRSDGIVVGNMQDRGSWSLDPDVQVRQQNVDAAIAFCAGMRATSAPASVTTRSSGPGSMPSVESFYGLES